MSSPQLVALQTRKERTQEGIGGTEKEGKGTQKRNEKGNRGTKEERKTAQKE
jgi:hypothetical protein